MLSLQNFYLLNNNDQMYMYIQGNADRRYSISSYRDIELSVLALNLLIAQCAGAFTARTDLRTPPVALRESDRIADSKFKFKILTH